MALCKTEFNADANAGTVEWRSAGIWRTAKGSSKLDEVHFIIAEMGDKSYSAFLAKGNALLFLVVNTPKLEEAKRSVDELSALLWNKRGAKTAEPTTSCAQANDNERL